MAPWLREGGIREGLAASRCIDHTSTGGLCGHRAMAQPPHAPTPWDFALRVQTGWAHLCPRNALGQPGRARVRDNDLRAPVSPLSAILQLPRHSGGRGAHFQNWDKARDRVVPE